MRTEIKTRKVGCIPASGRYPEDDLMKLSELKSKGQLLKPILKIGKAGLTPEFLKSVDETLKHHELIKIKFDDHKEEKKVLAPLLAEKTSSQLVMRVGNVVVLYRAKANQPEVAD